MIDITVAAAERLRELIEPHQLPTIGLVAEYAAAKNLALRLPAAYVLPIAERAVPSEVYGTSRQRHTCSFSVVLCTRYAGDAGGMRTVAALQELREAVQAALVNWTPASRLADQDCAAVAFSGGELLEFADGMTVWSDEFTFDRWVTRP